MSIERLKKFHKNLQKIRKCKDPEILNSIIRNISSSTLTGEEMNALSDSLDEKQKEILQG